MILGIFFARFLPQEGTKVVHQSPTGSIAPEPGANKECLFDFETMAEYVIPRQVFCNRYVTICDPENRYRILGHPVCIKDERYERNEFMFNFCIVLAVDTDALPYESVVRRLASTFTEMEIQNQYLSQENVSNTKDRRSISALLEIIKEDLNNYNECMIPVDDANTINMKLFPIHKPPPPVKSWHVPVSKMKFRELIDENWDLTLVKVVNHIDGVRDVRRIADAAEVSLDLTKLALQHLLYYDAILIVDMFFFGNIYAPNPEIKDFIADRDKMQDECANYVYSNGSAPRLSNYYLCRLYTSLATSRTLHEWIKLHMDTGFPVMDYVDVRRLIQFGIIKGFLYRVHKYAVSSQTVAALVGDQNWDRDRGDYALQKYTDGCHCFDQIIVETNMADVHIIEQLKKFPKGDVQIIYR